MSRPTHADQTPMTLYHGTKHMGDLSTDHTVDGGLHFGTYEQAKMRNAQRIISAQLDIHKVRRSKDQGGNWKARIAGAKSSGFEAIVYLNRYEGIPTHRVEAAIDDGVDLDKLTDTAFKKRIPEAEDSWIVFDMDHVKILSIEDKNQCKAKKAGP